MILLSLYAFLGGVVTILSPCILPVLPIILSSSLDNSGKRRPLGVVAGFVLSFTFFTLFLSSIVRLSGIPADAFRSLSIIILIFFGLSLIVPNIQVLFERLFSDLMRFAPKQSKRPGFTGGLIIGFSLGLLWTPCVGPILASVISLALSGQVTGQAFIITFSYAVGTAIPMFLIIRGGSGFMRKNQFLVKNIAYIQKIFGVLMVITAIGIFFNIDRKFQIYILDKFPQYGTGLTKLEDNQLVSDLLDNFGTKKNSSVEIGKPMPGSQTTGPVAPELITGGEWFNTADIISRQSIVENSVLQSLRGRVVLIDFWTYSCINCQRTLPYLRSWWDKYRNSGLVIIGVHSPEFEFEKNPQNVREAIEDFDLGYPIVQDNDFATWRAYDNRYWPAKYLIDKDGVIRYTHFGEGEYEETEQMIRELLREAGAQDFSASTDTPGYQIYSKTPETYLGYKRLDNFASPEQIAPDFGARYSRPSEIDDNHFAFDGVWTVTEEYARPEKNSQLYLNFEAKKVFLVIAPDKNQCELKVYLDGKQQFPGLDVENGIVKADQDRLYELVNLKDPGRHVLRLQFNNSNCRLFAFTFG